MECTHINGTPVFKVTAPRHSPWGDLYGAAYRDGAWCFAAYYPLGAWSLRDAVARNLVAQWTPEAEERRGVLRQEDAAWRGLEERWRRGEDTLPHVPSSFFPRDFQPYGHQRYGIAQLQLWWRRWFLWKMGTGKTRTVIDACRLLARRGAFRKALVVGPPVVLDGWEAEVRRCSQGDWHAVRLDGTARRMESAWDAQFVLVSYARVRRAAIEKLDVGLGAQEVFAPERSPLLELQYDVLVADEAHNLGNWSSDQTQATIALAAKAARRIFLTGTPGDDPRKLYPQLYGLAPALVNTSYSKFEAKHVEYRPNNPHVVERYQGLAELNQRVDAIATRMKKEDCLDLPPLQEIDIFFDLGIKQQARYNELVTSMRASMEPVLEYLSQENPDSEDRKRNPRVLVGQPPPESEDAPLALRVPHGAVRVNKLLQIVSGFLLPQEDTEICDTCPHLARCVEEGIKPHTRRCEVSKKAPPRKVLRDVENPKLEAFTGLLNNILEDDPTNKVIAWGNYDEELDDMCAAAKATGFKYLRLDGRTTNKAGALQAQFQTDPDCRILVGMESAGIGINLPIANYMIFYSLSWEPLEYEQARERMNRPGQTRKMIVYRLLTSVETPALDRSVAAMLRFKNAVSYTMTERITCAQCKRQPACALDGTRPFRENCEYAGARNRPHTRVRIL